MSTLQFVILLVVIFISTNGRLSTMTKYVRKMRTWLFKYRVTKIRATLARHGVLFRNSSAKDFGGMCLSEDFFAQEQDKDGLRKVPFTFVFPIRDRYGRAFYEKKGQELVADFLYELCNKQYPRKWFSFELLRELKTFAKTEKTLFVPQNVNPEQSLVQMKIRLDKYVLDNR